MNMFECGGAETQSNRIPWHTAGWIRAVAIRPRNKQDTFANGLFKQRAGPRGVEVFRKCEPDIKPAVRMGPMRLTGKKITEVLLKRRQHAPGFFMVTASQNLNVPVVQAAGHGAIDEMLAHVRSAEIEVVFEQPDFFDQFARQ